MDNANSENLWHYNTRLRNFANQNRKGMTKAEACIWKFILRGRGLKGYQFRRQRPILNYIADFMCKELMLVIEVDGLIHLREDIAANDIVRENALKQIGFAVIRFDNEEVLNDMANVKRKLLFFIEEFEGGRRTSHPL
ncbi:DUF559 domain-containing protein [Pedobacter sp. LMG 31464]|uniref:DUF559 domain-containing protein n=1 Tax=Pedobacter planticolens TaxID=2679964 RepID=A0A923DWX4_9SPHI|nr:endonuclease domain-containing protein [Pedobacter planticolens]MBB2145487.1 DUF559 domain-containing protein [Pedobacter planticolens]